jgi:hypothetical protein
MNEQYQAMSATGRFAMVVLGVIVLLLLWSELFLPWANGWGEQATAIEQSIVMIDDAGRGGLSTRNAVLAYGPVETPGTREDGSQALLVAIKAVMAHYGITDYKLNESGSGVTVRGLTGGRIERIKADLTFNAQGETAIEVIADLEANAAIESIESLRLTRGKRSGTLDITATAEAWVLARIRRR